jgi:uncharacterized protein YjiS (DUF1127 family)
MTRTHDNHAPLGALSTLGQTLEAAAGPLQLAVQAIAGWRPVARLSEMIHVSRTRRDLLDLDDRLLADIGVTRLDIEREGRRRFWDLDD